MSFLAVNCYAQNSPVLPAKPNTDEKQIDIPYNIKMKFADLSPDEQRLISAYIRTPDNTPRFNALKQKILRTIGNLYAEYMKLPINAPERISITAKLVDYSRIIRGSGITTAELRSATKNCGIGKIITSKAAGTVSPDEVKSRQMLVSTDELPEELKTILKNIEYKEECSYMKYLCENVNFVLFTPQLNGIVTIMTDDDIGTAEELTRTAIVDTYYEGNSGYVKTWFLAMTILTEASHIEWYYRHNGDPSLLGYDLNEANSIIFTNDFLSKLLAGCGTLIGKDEKSDILYVISENKKKLEALRAIK